MKCMQKDGRKAYIPEASTILRTKSNVFLGQLVPERYNCTCSLQKLQIVNQCSISKFHKLKDLWKKFKIEKKKKKEKRKKKR
ncbi:hypothetical protein D8674_018492 [Pyrus ussuriensis x Pyrus communis]|uniref:Uncharacterized protein n=1 Tax=Pyrus ussuriensis x Pyrus communis TaxID=2448454 RepID=A0A5N5GAA9_9ROSA|nr:hypothetical protein D8674_018492 [Pyrus ussuriensis x Pyrus communis]